MTESEQKTTKKSPASKAKAPSKKAKDAKPAKKKAATITKPALESKAPAAAKKTVDKTGPAASAAKKTVAPSKVSGATGVIEIKLVRSLIGSSPRQRAVAAGLGLRRLNQVVTRQDTREIRGMVAKVAHLVNILA